MTNYVSYHKEALSGITNPILFYILLSIFKILNSKLDF